MNLDFNKKKAGCVLENESQGGFVLISVLGVILLLSFVGSILATFSEQKIEEALLYKKKWSEKLDSDSTLATILYSMSVSKPYYGGFALSNEKVMAVDGRFYKGVGNAYFSVQEESSLLSLMSPDKERWFSLLGEMNVPSSERERFLDQLLDYTDEDDLKRINGATSFDYQQAGLPLPTHRFMNSPGQVFNLLGADAWQPWLKDILPYITDKSGQQIKPNTMPASLLKTLPGWDSSLVSEVLKGRQQKSFNSLNDLNKRTGRLVPVDEFSLNFYPGLYHRVKIWDGKSGCSSSLWVGISLTYSSVISPWDINYVFDYEDESSGLCESRRKIATIFP